MHIDIKMRIQSSVRFIVVFPLDFFSHKCVFMWRWHLSCSIEVILDELLYNFERGLAPHSIAIRREKVDRILVLSNFINSHFYNF